MELAARFHARRLAGPEASARTGVLSRGLQRRETHRARSRHGTAALQRQGPERRGAVPRDSVVWRRGRSSCASACRKSRQGCCAQTAIWHQLSARSDRLSVDRAACRLPITGKYHAAALGTTAARRTLPQTRFALRAHTSLRDAAPAGAREAKEGVPGPAAATASCQKEKDRQ